VEEKFHLSLSLSDFSLYFSLFPQYLGLVEVEESRGMHVCEDAVKKLKLVRTVMLSILTE